MNTAYSALTGLNVIIGLFSSMAVNMPDFGRWSKNRLAGKHQNNSMTVTRRSTLTVEGGHQFFALPIIGTLGALTP
jgi:NCS1 family nucleobase:cation symporter-1